MLPTEQLQTARAAVRALLLRGQRKLLTAAVADLEALHLVVVHVDLQASSERQRQLCLRRLLYELDDAGVAQVHLEAPGDPVVPAGTGGEPGPDARRRRARHPPTMATAC